MEEKERIDLKYVQDLYNNMENIWPSDDAWYTYTHQKIINYIKDYINNNHFVQDSRILNIGSGGNTYDIPGKQYHTDIAYEKIRNIPNSYLANAELLPFQDNYFDGGICVGSVINYCDPYKVINEISRTLKPNCYFVLDFEQSRSFQFINTHDFNSDATIVESFNSGHTDQIWIYSERYILNILQAFNLRTSSIQRFHILSPLLYKWTNNEQFSAKIAILDKYVKHIPYIRKFSCNTILTIHKV